MQTVNTVTYTRFDGICSYNFIKVPLNSESAFMHRCCPSVHFSVCLSEANISKTKQFRAMVSIDDQYDVLNGFFKKTHSWAPKIQDGKHPPS